MKHLLPKIALCLLFPLCASSASAELQINEVMQSNVHGIMDDFNEFPDSWVELYNNSSSAVNLSDYALSVKDSYQKAFKLPNKILQPGEFVIIYCDKADTSGENGNHADFRVDSGKGSLYLWKNGEISETVTLKKMPAPDVSYGRVTEKEDNWGYQATATPGTGNCGKVVTDVLPEPEFSTTGGICTTPLTLVLSLPEDAPSGAKLHYTLDGSVPTAASPVYNKGINISDNTVVRASIFADGYMTPLPTTHSYIFHPREITLPIVSMTGNPEYFYDDKIGILADGTYSEGKENFRYDWRRPINIEFFEIDGSTPINQVGETRLKGFSSRNYPMRSMVLYANKRFVTKRLEHEFFPEQRPDVTDFKSIELRNAGQDFSDTYMRDAVFQTAVSAGSNLGFSAYRPVIFYLNGKYMGIMNLRERGNEDNIYTNYDGLEDVDVIEDWWEVNEGDAKEFSEFKKFYTSVGHTYKEFEQKMFIDQFSDLMMSHAVFNAIDFPNSNIVMWRPKTEDGKWGWIMKDQDVSLGIWGMPSNFNYLDWLYDPEYSDIFWGNTERGTKLFRVLMEYPEFRNDFIDRMAIAMGDYLHPQTVGSIIDRFADKISAEFPYHNELYMYDRVLNERTDYMKSWYEKRVTAMYDIMAEHFKLNKPASLKIDGYAADDMEVSINGHILTMDKFDGKWFPGRKLTASATMPEGDTAVVGWKVTTTNNDNTETETTYSTPKLELTFPSAVAVKIKPIQGPSAVEDIDAEPEEATVEWYDLQGRSLGNTRPAPGIYLRKAGKHVTKTVVR